MEYKHFEFLIFSTVIVEIKHTHYNAKIRMIENTVSTSIYKYIEDLH